MACCPDVTQPTISTSDCKRKKALATARNSGWSSTSRTRTVDFFIARGLSAGDGTAERRENLRRRSGKTREGCQVAKLLRREGNFEIGRVLHLKSEIRNLKLDYAPRRLLPVQ